MKRLYQHPWRITSILVFVWCLLPIQILEAQSASLPQWQKTDLPDVQFYALTSDPLQSNILLAGSWGSGVFRSTDDGETWTPFNEGLPNLLVRALVMDTEGSAYVGTFGDGIYRSLDADQPWLPVNAGLDSPHIYALATDSAGNLYAGTASKGIYRLTWNSSAWTAQGLDGFTVTALAVSPSEEQVIYAGTWEGGVFHSSDGGTTWTQSEQGLQDTNIRALAIHPEDARIAYVGTWGSGVYRTQNGGETWIEINGGLSARYLYTLEIYPSTRELVYAGTKGNGISRLVNKDTLWTPYGMSGSEVRSLVTVPAGFGHALFAGTDSGVWRHQVQPALVISKQNEPSGPVYHGDIITYTLSYTNTGELELSDIVINDLIPAGTEYKTGSTDPSEGRYVPALDLVEWTLPALAVGESGRVSFAVQFPEPSTPTPTGQPTAIETRTPTATASRTAISSATPTSSATFTPSYTYTIDATTTPTASATMTLTTTASPTPTSSATATSTASLLPTATPTFSTTVTPSITPSVTPSPSSTPTATESATPTPFYIDLLANGNFETGSLAGWTAEGKPQVVTSISHFGRYAALLGGYNQAQDSLCQQITIPTDTLDAQVNYWWYMKTEQVAHPRDQLFLELYDAKGNFMTNLDVIDDGETPKRWKTSDPFDLSAYAGQRIWTCFACQTNQSDPTWFYIDDVRLQVRLPWDSASIAPLLGQRDQTESDAPSVPTRESISVFNRASIYSTQTGWVHSNAVINSPRQLSLPLVVKP